MHIFLSNPTHHTGVRCVAIEPRSLWVSCFTKIRKDRPKTACGHWLACSRREISGGWKSIDPNQSSEVEAQIAQGAFATPNLALASSTGTLCGRACHHCGGTRLVMICGSWPGIRLSTVVHVRSLRALTPTIATVSPTASRDCQAAQ